MASDNITQRILLVDPNPAGHNSVDLSKLSIIVEMDTTKKNRSVVVVEEGKGKVINSNSTTKPTTVKFIDGTTYGDKKQLTTNYTEINTTFNKRGNDLETLGITNIQIDFNSSYTPLITLDLVDIRGNSMFEKGADSKYSVFFEMPYPIFSLTIKGFYGKTVTYCLHLVKWKAVFNQDTGNFEIKCEFTGYTYAFLTDMLMGYLKAITYTERGKKLLENYKLTDGTPTPTIISLFEKISQISSDLTTLSKDDENVKRLKKGTEVIDKYNHIISVFESYANNLSGKSGGGAYIGKQDEIIDSQTIDLRGLIVLKDSNNDTEILRVEDETTTLINSLIKESNDSLKEVKYRLDTFQPNGNRTAFTTKKKYTTIKNPQTVKDLENFFKTTEGGAINDNQNLDVYDYSIFIKQVNDRINEIKNANKANTDIISAKLTTDIPEKLGFKPTIRNIFSIFCAHAEILVQTILDVAKEAEKSPDRNAKFAPYVKGLDVNKNSDIHAFPTFVVETKEEWMGSKIQTPETKFIEELLQGLLTAKELEDNALNSMGINSKGWVPINPLDTTLGINTTNPYLAISNSSQRFDFFKLMILRAITFLGYTSLNLSKAEIQAMAKFEANNLYNSIKNDVVKTALLDTYTSHTALINNMLGKGDSTIPAVYDEYKKNFGITNNVNGKILIDNAVNSTDEESGKYYKYIYLRGGDNAKHTIYYIPQVIQLGDKFTNYLGTNGQVDSSKIKNEKYVSSYFSFNKPDSDGKFIEIIDFENYKGINPPDYADTIFESDKLVSESNISSDVLEGDLQPTTNGANDYNQFAGLYKTQEFSLIDDKPSYLLFYTNSYTYPSIRKVGLANFYENYQKDFPLNFDLRGDDENFTNIGTSENLNFDIYHIKTRGDESDKKRNLGNSREILEKLENNVYYPFIDFSVTTENETKIFSLFGSDFYYSQSINKKENESNLAKAYLFLHTLSFNGLQGINSNGLFSDEIIHNLFKRRAGFISAPKSWVLFIGALLWRYESTSEPINLDGFIPLQNSSSKMIPSSSQYMTVENGAPLNFTENGNYLDIEPSILNLPQQVKTEFINQFTSWVSSKDIDGWISIKSGFEIVNIDTEGGFIDGYNGPAGTGFQSLYNNFLSNTTKKKLKEYDLTDTDGKSKSLLKNVDNLVLINRIQKYNDSNFNNSVIGNFYLEYKPNFESMNKLVDFYSQNSFILNSTWMIWINEERDEDLIDVYFKKDIDTQKSIRFLDNFKYDPDNTVGFKFATPHGLKVGDTINIVQDAGFVHEEYNDTTEVTQVLDGLRIVTDIGWEGDTTANPGTISITTEVEYEDDINTYDQSILIKKEDIHTYLDVFLATIKALNTEKVKEKSKVNLQQAIFQTMDNNTIKLVLYQDIKAIFDKWISGTDTPLKQCIGLDKGFFNKRRNENNQQKLSGELINSFHFVSKSMQDIGDKFFINPFGLVEYIKNDFNQSLYDVISRTLADTNFNFVSLPSFINYYDKKDIEEAFTPYSYNDAITISEDLFGPAFVCTYIDTKSVNLDLGDNSLFPSDAVTINTDFITTAPKSFTENGPDDLTIPVFAVNYADENQSMFKNMKLNQESFSQTSEVLRNLEEIAQGGNPNRRTYIGQNLFNVYSKRAYTVEIETLGNAMIQPMMYFQLNSVPMFHGTYLIIKVSHSIVPGDMTTTFRGVRIGNRDLPLIEESTAYMNLLPNTEDGESSGSISAVDTSLPTTVDQVEIKLKQNSEELKNLELIKQALIKRGITDKFILAGIMSVIYEESGLKPITNELNYTVENLLKIFPKIFQTREEAESVKGNPKAIAKKLYPNEKGDDGYTYRPRGFIQVTKKATYIDVSKGISRPDILTKPELLITDKQVSADAAAWYLDTRFKEGIQNGNFKKFTIYNTADVNTSDKAVKFVLQSVFGLESAINEEFKKAYSRALSFFDFFYSIVSK